MTTTKPNEYGIDEEVIELCPGKASSLSLYLSKVSIILHIYPLFNAHTFINDNLYTSFTQKMTQQLLMQHTTKKMSLSLQYWPNGCDHINVRVFHSCMNVLWDYETLVVQDAF
jgi:hypothetical protein